MPGQWHRISGPWPSWAGEDKAELYPQWEGAEPPGNGWDTGHLGQSFMFAIASINPTTTPHPPRHGFPKCFSRDSMEEPYFHQQHQLTCPVRSPRPAPHSSHRDAYCPYAHCSLSSQINSIYLVHSILCIKTNLTYEEMLILNPTFPKGHLCSTQHNVVVSNLWNNDTKYSSILQNFLSWYALLF